MKGYLIPIVYVIILFIVFNNSKNIAIYLNSGNHDKQHHQKVAGFIKSTAGNKSFSIFTSTPYEKSNYYSLEFLYALRKINSFPTGIRMDTRGELYYNFNPDKDLLFLICKEFHTEIRVIENCLNPFLSEYGFNKYLLRNDIGSDSVFVFMNTKEI